jgi:UDP-N-acetylglucosamine:LPS N-acetylglucosamine transferase
VIPTKSTNICIYFADTGGGHRSAAQAIKAGIELAAEKEGRSVHVISQPIIEQSHPINKLLVRAYNYLACYHPTWIKHFYNLIHVAKLESGLHISLCRSYAHNILSMQDPALVVSVHPLLAQALALFLKELGLRPAVKLAVVVTDPNDKLWRAWACEDADLIIAPNNIARDCLLRWGIPADKIQVLGMPVHPEFLSPTATSRADFLNSLGLDPNTFTLCINSGWAGNSHLLSLFYALKKCKRKLQIIFLSGYNKRLYENTLSAAQATNIPTVVLPFYDKMPELMRSVDAMVTKAGGLTTYQAVAARLPLIFDNTIEPMPQEAPTMEMLVNAGVATRLDRADDIAPIVERIDIVPDKDRALPILPIGHELDLTDQAIYDISHALLQLSNSHIELESSNSVEYVA